MTGPIARERLNWSEFSATAFAIRSRGTRLVITAWYVGADCDCVRPVSEGDRDDRRDPEPVEVVEHAPGRAAIAIWNSATTAGCSRLSMRSATAPPISMNARSGASGAKLRSPR